MRPLPELVVGRRRWVLPMADRSAAALVEALLADWSPQANQSFRLALADDPPLVLWTVCIAGRRDGFEPHSLDDVARWLAEHALEVLQWEADQGARAEAIGPSQAESCADRVSRAVQVADLAAQLAAHREPSTAELASLLGLLHDAHGWLGTAVDRPAPDAASCLPGWLARWEDAPAAAPVQRAAGVLVGEAPLPEGTPIDLEACRRRGAEGRRRWLMATPGAGELLPPLTAKLGRLAALEHRFQQTLETEKLEAMAEFAAGAGHEINNPLTVIAGRAQLFLRGEGDPERRRGLALISAQAMRVYEMIADMMLFARPPKPEPEGVELVALVDRLIEGFAPQAAPHEVTVSRSGGAGPVEIEADPTQLGVALRAMCQNALEAIGHHGRIVIGVDRRGSEAEIRVCDDGPGIPPEVRPHLFDPFYSAREAGRGLGLGLSKAWRIVTNHVGRIEVKSGPGQWTVFTITLPGRQP